MKCFIALVGLLAVLAAVAPAGEPKSFWDGLFWSDPCKAGKKLDCLGPDDYDRKTLPCVTPNVKGCENDYCNKCLPRVMPNAKGCEDDYCARPCKLILGRIFEPWHRLVPSGDEASGPCKRCQK